MNDNEGILFLYNRLCQKFVGNNKTAMVRSKKYFEHFLNATHHQKHMLDPSQELLSVIYNLRQNKKFVFANQLEHNYNKLKNILTDDIQMIIRFLTLLKRITIEDLTKINDLKVDLIFPCRYTYFPSSIFEKPFYILPPANNAQNQDEGFQEKDYTSILDPALLKNIRPPKYSWETLGTVSNCSNQSFLTQSGTKALDMLLITHFQRMSLIADKISPSPEPFFMETVFNDIPNLLIGVPSSTFNLMENDKFILNPSSYLPGITSNFMEEFLEAGSQYLYLEKFIASPSGSLTLQAFKKGVEEFLDLYKLFILKLVPGLHSLMKIKNLLNSVIHKIGYVATLCRYNGGPQQGTVPRDLLAYLYDRCVQGNAHIFLLVSLLRAASLPYLNFLQKWLFEGILEDPFNEFPITRGVTYHFSEDYWSKCFYQRQELPFFSHISSKLMVCGKSFSLLRLCFPAYFQLLFGESAYPLLKIQLSHQDVALLDCTTRDYISDLERKLSRALQLKQQQSKSAKESSASRKSTSTKESEAKATLEAAALDKKKRQYLQDLRAQMEEDRRRKSVKEEYVVEDFFDEELVEEVRREIIEEYQRRMDSIDLQMMKFEWRAKRLLLKPKRDKFLETLDDSESIDETDRSIQLPTSSISSPHSTEYFSLSSKQDIPAAIPSTPAVDNVIPAAIPSTAAVDNENNVIPAESNNNNLVTPDINANALQAPTSLPLLDPNNNSNATDKEILTPTSQDDTSNILDFQNENDLLKEEDKDLEDFLQKEENSMEETEGDMKVKPYAIDFSILDASEIVQVGPRVKSKCPAGDEMEELMTVPFPVLMRRSLEPLLLSHTQLVNRTLLSLFLEDLRIKEQFTLLRNLFFFYDGDFGSSLSTKLFQKLSVCQHPSELLNPFVMNHLLDEAISSSIHCSSFYDNFSFYVEKMPETLSGVLPSLQLKYRTSWPCNLIITDASLEDYSRIFSFFLQIKKVVWHLDDLFLQLREFGHCSSHHYRKVQLFRHGMCHFARVLHYYVTGHVLEMAWREFSRALSTEVQDMEELKEAHRAYLKKVTTECLLHKKSQPILKIVHGILEVILKFCKQVTFHSWEADSSSGELAHPQFQQLVASHALFRQQVEFLLKVLVGCKQPHHLVALLDIAHHRHR